MNTGEEFVKKIGPFGAILLLICFVGFLAVCFTSGLRAPEQTYVPAQEAAYYQGNPEALQAELEQTFLPELSASAVCTVEDGVVIVTVQESDYTAVSSALNEAFDGYPLILKTA